MPEKKPVIRHVRVFLEQKLLLEFAGMRTPEFVTRGKLG